MRHSYDSVHKELRETRGKASDQDCECGEPAWAWAYQYNGDPEYCNDTGSFPYALDVYKNYAPMCRTCHTTLDAGQRMSNPEKAAKRREIGRRVGLLPAGSKALENLEKGRATLAARVSPERRAELEAHKKRREATRPEISAVRAKAARVANSKRRRCLDCGRISIPAGMGRHLKSSGHSGYEDLPTQ